MLYDLCNSGPLVCNEWHSPQSVLRQDLEHACSEDQASKGIHKSSLKPLLMVATVVNGRKHYTACTQKFFHVCHLLLVTFYLMVINYNVTSLHLYLFYDIYSLLFLDDSRWPTVGSQKVSPSRSRSDTDLFSFSIVTLFQVPSDHTMGQADFYLIGIFSI